MSKPDAVLRAYLGVSSKSQEELVLRLLIELGAQFVAAQEGSLLVFDEKKNKLVFAMTVGSTASEKSLIGQCVPLGTGITGLAAQTREVQIGAPTFKTRQAKTKQPQAVLAAPMLIADQLIGVITAVRFTGDNPFTSTDALLYGRIAAVAGVVVDQARRLAGLAALKSGHRLPAPQNQEERSEREIVDAVTKLVHHNPQVKARVARLLKELVAVVAE